MKKKDVKKMALIGLGAGFLISGNLQAATATADDKTTKTENPNDGNLDYHLMTEDELLLELNPEGAALYKSLDPKGKELAREVASMRCNGTNLCQHLGVDQNSCAGKNACKGKGKCAIADKNLAVKLVAEKLKMEGKRTNATK